MDLDLKAKRIVYQMSQGLERTPVDHDFHEALLSLPLPDLDKQAGFDGFLKLQDDIKESLKKYIKFGEKSNFLTRLSGQQMKCVNQMLSKEKSKSKSSRSGEHTGEVIRAKTVKAVNSEEVQISKAPIPFGIPPLEVEGLYREGVDRNSHSDEEEDWLNSEPGPSSSRIPEIPMEPIPQLEPPKSVKFVDSTSAKITVPVKKIVSRARPIQKSDAQIQTENVEQEEEAEALKTEGSEKITAEIGTNCRLLITPRVEEDYAPSGISLKTSPPLSPISTVPSEDISEGEVIRPIGRITVVRTDGSIVPTPRVMEDTDSENLLIAKSSSPFGVADIEMSISSAHSF